jgi:hypothetical protein
MFDDQLKDVHRIYVLLVFLFFCLHSFAGNRVPESINNINWITVWLAFLFGVLFTMLFRFLNRRTKIVDQRSNAGQPMNNWIVLLGVCLAARIIVQIYFFWEADYFLKSTWTNLELAGGVKFHSLFIFEMFLSLFALSGTGVLLYWFLGKRDIFPAMFVYYACFYLIANFIMLIIFHNTPVPSEMVTIRPDSLIQIIRICVAAAWVVFVLKSERVKQTFVYPPA